MQRITEKNRCYVKFVNAKGLSYAETRGADAEQTRRTAEIVFSLRFSAPSLCFSA